MSVFRKASNLQIGDSVTVLEDSYNKTKAIITSVDNHHPNWVVISYTLTFPNMDGSATRYTYKSRYSPNDLVEVFNWPQELSSEHV